MSEIVNVNTQNFETLLQSDLPVLVDFWAPWCGPCRTVSPIVDELAVELADRVLVAKCNVDENQDIAMRYRVMSIPTLIVLKNGAEAGRTVGAMPKPQLRAEIEKYL